MAVQIPGIKVLDEILAGLPTNSKQRLEIGELKAQIAILERENQELKAKVGALSPKSDMAVDTAKILQNFFRHDRPFTAEGIAHGFNMEPSVGKYHIDLLLAKKLIWHHDRVIMNDAPPRFVITAKGRAYVIENGLA